MMKKKKKLEDVVKEENLTWENDRLSEEDLDKINEALKEMKQKKEK
ncbi:hypothetical protein [Bacillus taeanensis]|nr:hypothetical protein [Bacillus taeanensis]